MSNVVVRDFDPADLDEAFELINTVLGQRFGFRDDSRNPDLYDIAAYYADDCFLVAVLDGALVGTGGLVLESRLLARVVRMHAAEAFRRGGIGRAVIIELERRAIARGARGIILDTNLDWHDAHGFYRSVGYRELRRNAMGIRFHKVIG